MKKRIPSLVLVFSMLLLICPTYGKKTRAADVISVAYDPNSIYGPTQIINGDFDDEPFMKFKYNGRVYTAQCGVSGQFIEEAYPNGVDGGWNTTENKLYAGTLFEYTNSASTYHLGSANGYFIEMNANQCATLYQDLSTKGGDVMRWTLLHGFRAPGSDWGEQEMTVYIGAPNSTGSVTNTDPNITPASLGVFKSSGVSGAYAYGNTNGLANLDLPATTAGGWYSCSGVYVVPEGQTVTRFAFEADKPSSGGGNCLDSITFSTLIGNLDAVYDGTNVIVRGYWGDSDSTKKLCVKIGNTVYQVDMSAVLNKNFTVTIPPSMIGDETSVTVYHPDYQLASKNITIEHHRHCPCGKTSCSISGHDTEHEWLAWTSSNSLPTTAGYYFLANDVTISSTWTPVSGTYLCLNGHVIRRSGSGNVINVASGRSFTLTDCKETVHYYTVGSTGLWTLNTSATSGTAFENLTARPAANSVIAVKGGAITGGNGDNGNGAGAISCEGSFTMYGGNIIGNTTGVNGGAINTQGSGTGSFTMNGGRLVGNTANNWGGAVFVYVPGTSMTMNGGTVAYNTCGANYTGTAGGAIATYGGSFTMNGGTITRNLADRSGHGGGVCVHAGSFTMNGGSITENSATTGAGVYQNSTMTVGGDANISGNKVGTAKSNLYLATGKTVAVSTSNPPSGMSVGVATQTAPSAGSPVNVTGNNSADYSGSFTNDTTNYALINAGSGSSQVVRFSADYQAKIVKANGETTYYASFVQACNTAPAGCTVYLLKDVSGIMINTLNVNANCTVDLGGFTAKGHDTFYVNNGAVVTLKNGTIDCESGSSCVGVHTSGTLYLENVKLTGFNAYYGTGGNTYFGEGVKCETGSLYSSNGNGTLHITDGKYDFSTLDCVGTTATDRLFITGGCFSYTGSNLKNYLKPGYTTSTCIHGRDNGSDVVLVEEDIVAEVHHGSTVTKYGKVKDAVLAAQSGDTVVMVKSSIENVNIPANRNVTLDLNGKTLSAESGNVITVQSGATLKIDDTSSGKTGKITRSATSTVRGVYNLGTLTMVAGTITGCNSTSGGGVYQGGTMTMGGTATITGNSGGNLYLATGKTVAISTTNPPTTMSAGVSAQNPPTASTPVNVTGTNSADYTSYFTPDNTNYVIYNENNIVKMGVHAHNWQYALKSGTTDTVQATCIATIGEHVYTNNDTEIKISASNANYNGQAHAATLSKTSFAGISTMPSIQYQKKSGDTWGTATTTAPTNVGVYKASITFGTATASVEFTISKVYASITTPPSVKSLTYTGSNQALLNAGASSGGTLNYALGTSNTTAPTTGWSTTVPSQKDAGSYYVWYKCVGDDNHIDTAATILTATIAKKAVTVSNISATNRAYEPGNTSVTLVTTSAEFNGLVSGDSLTISADGSMTNADAGTGKTVTISNLVLSGDSISNYVLATTGNQATTTVTISQIASAISTAPSAKNLTYDATAQALVEAGVAENGTMQYALGANNTTAPTTGWSTSIPTGTGAGTYYVWYKNIGNTNYYATTPACVPVTIAKQEITVSSGITATDRNYIANDTSVELVFTQAVLTGKISGDDLSITATGAMDDANVGEDKNVTISDLELTGTKAANYVLAASGHQEETTVTISKIPSTMTTAPSANALTYNAIAQELVSGGDVQNGTLEYVLGTNATDVPTSGWSTSVPSQTLAGTYYVWYRCVGDSNHLDIDPACATVTIAQKTITVPSGISATDRDYIPGNTSVDLVLTQAVLDGKIDTDDLGVSAVGTMDDADVGEEKDVTISNLTLTGEKASNYVLAASGHQTTTKVTITQIASTIPTAPSAKNLTYNGNARELVNAGVAENGAMQYALGANNTTAPTTGWSTSIPTGTGAGSYYVWYKNVGNNNYYATTPACVPVVIARQEITVSSGIAATDRDYIVGDTSVELVFTQAVLTGKVSGDDLSITATGSMTNPDAGQNKKVTISNLALTGTKAANYVLAASGHQEEATVTIRQIASTIPVAPTARTLTYTSHPLELVTAGTAENGAMNFALGTSSTNAPTSGWNAAVPQEREAGTYYVWYKNIGNNNYYATEPVCIPVTIAREVITVTGGIAATDRNYEEGNTDVTLVTTLAVMSGMVTGDDVSLSATGTMTDADAGPDKTVTISNLQLSGNDARNYILAASGHQAETKVTISKVPATLSQAPTANLLTYDANSQLLVKKGEAVNGTLLYALGANNSVAPTGGWSTNIPTGLYASNYFVWYKVEGDRNHTDVAPACVRVTIQKKTIVVSGIAAEDRDYIVGDTSVNLLTASAILNGKCEGDDLGVTAIGTMNDANVGQNKYVGISQLRLVGEQSPNYTLSATQQTQTSVNIAPIPSYVTAAPTAKELIYNSQPQELVHAGTTQFGTMNYVLGTDNVTAPTDGWSTEIPTGTDASTYYVWYMCKANANYIDTVPACVAVTNGKPTIFVSGITAEDRDFEETQRGVELNYTDVVLDGMVEGDDLQVSAVGTMIDDKAGEDKIVELSNLELYGSSAKNYALATSNNQEETTVNIAPLPSEVIVAPEANSRTYDSTTQMLVTDGEAEHGTMYYALGEDDETAPEDGWTTEVPEAEDADTYYVWYMSVADENYYDTVPECVVVTIAQQVITVTEGVVAIDRDYVPDDTSVEMDVGQAVLDGKVEDDDLAIVATGTMEDDKAGEGKLVAIEYELTGETAKNYVLAESGHQVETTVNIAKVSASLITAPTAKALIYSGLPLVLASEGEAENGTLYYAMGTSRNTPPTEGWSTSIPSASLPDTYYVWYKVVADENYFDTEPVCIESSIVEMPVYAAYDGGNGTWFKGSEKDYILTVKRSCRDETCFSHFTGVLIDGQLIELGKDYTAHAGSTVVTLKSATLQNLTVGIHEVTVLFDDGQMTTYLTVKTAFPKTGDTSLNTIGFELIFVACIGFAFAGVYAGKKRREEQEEG